MSENGMIVRLVRGVRKVLQEKGEALQEVKAEPQRREKMDKHSKGKRNMRVKKINNSNGSKNSENKSKSGRTLNESELLEQMKRDLDKKYELEQEMARLMGGDTGLVQVQMRLRKAELENDSGSILFLGEIFGEKKVRLKKKMEDHKRIIAKYQKYQRKSGDLNKEWKWEDLIWRLTKEDDNERLYQELLQYPCSNEKKQDCNE